MQPACEVWPLSLLYVPMAHFPVHYDKLIDEMHKLLIMRAFIFVLSAFSLLSLFVQSGLRSILQGNRCTHREFVHHIYRCRFQLGMVLCTTDLWDHLLIHSSPLDITHRREDQRLFIERKRYYKRLFRMSVDSTIDDGISFCCRLVFCKLRITRSLQFTWRTL